MPCSFGPLDPLGDTDFGIGEAVRQRHTGPSKLEESAWISRTVKPAAIIAAVMARQNFPATRSNQPRCLPTAAVRRHRPCPGRRQDESGGNGSGPPRDSRTRVRELVARERATGIRLHARDVAAAAGISERRAYELLRAVRAEEQQP